MKTAAATASQDDVIVGLVSVQRESNRSDSAGRCLVGLGETLAVDDVFDDELKRQGGDDEIKPLQAQGWNPDDQSASAAARPASGSVAISGNGPAARIAAVEPRCP